MSDSALLLEIAFVTTVSTIVLIYSVRRGSRISAPWIIRHALRTPGDEHNVQVTGFLGTWNPAGKAVGERIYGAGTGVYRRRASADGDVIDLEFTPKRGEQMKLTGSIPEQLRNERRPDGNARRRLPPLWSVLVIQGALALVGVVIGWTTTASGTTARTVAVIGGGFSGMFLPPSVGVAVLGVRALRDIGGSRSRARSATSAAAMPDRLDPGSTTEPTKQLQARTPKRWAKVVGWILIGVQVPLVVVMILGSGDGLTGLNVIPGLILGCVFLAIGHGRLKVGAN